MKRAGALEQMASEEEADKTSLKGAGMDAKGDFTFLETANTRIVAHEFSYKARLHPVHIGAHSYLNDSSAWHK